MRGSLPLPQTAAPAPPDDERMHPFLSALVAIVRQRVIGREGCVGLCEAPGAGPGYPTPSCLSLCWVRCLATGQKSSPARQRAADQGRELGGVQSQARTGSSEKSHARGLFFFIPLLFPPPPSSSRFLVSAARGSSRTRAKCRAERLYSMLAIEGCQEESGAERDGVEREERSSSPFSQARSGYGSTKCRQFRLWRGRSPDPSSSTNPEDAV